MTRCTEVFSNCYEGFDMIDSLKSFQSVQKRHPIPTWRDGMIPLSLLGVCHQQFSVVKIEGEFGILVCVVFAWIAID
jgi:hypothetical protein